MGISTALVPLQVESDRAVLVSEDFKSESNLQGDGEEITEWG